MKKIFAISGSTRNESTNLNLIRAITSLTSGKFEMDLYENISNLPHFNPDIEKVSAPESVTAFRNRIDAADGILICTPEYAMGVPGSLKNAIDWTVSSNNFYKKPTVLITASSVGQKGHAALLETLKVIDARMESGTQLIIPFASTKISKNCTISDEGVAVAISRLIDAFEALMNEPKPDEHATI
jgi:chromate reductase, NAD(P)H dehydrogenase (quinone)